MVFSTKKQIIPLTAKLFHSNLSIESFVIFAIDINL